MSSPTPERSLARTLVLGALAPTVICGLAAAQPAGEPSPVPGASIPSELAQDAKPAAPEAKKSEGDLRVYWRDGLRLETSDGLYKLRISGRVQNDWAFFSGDEGDFGLDFNDGTEFRRAYFGFQGTVYGNIEIKAEYDFAPDTANFVDVYMGFVDLHGVNVRVGHFKEPTGLEELTSDLNSTFMERGLTNRLGPVRNTGIMVFDSALEEDLTWAVGFFRDSNGFADDLDANQSDHSFTGRVTYCPWYEEKGARSAHVGASYSVRDTDAAVTFTSKPESNIAPNVITTAAMTTDEHDLLGLEAAVVLGSLSFQTELTQARIDGTSANEDDPTLTGFYVYASYFLTGEYRPYSRSTGTYERIKPKTNYGKDGGSGAWELALRFSTLDFDEANADQELTDITLGANWYLNPNARIQANIVHADSELVDETMDIFQLRFQFDW